MISQNPVNPEQVTEPETGNLGYTGVCVDFLTSLGKAAKIIALYKSGHPVAAEAIRKAYEFLDILFLMGKKDRVTVSTVKDSWLLNETPLPPGNQAENFKPLFMTHGIRSLTFLRGVRPFEISALCELLGMSPINKPEGYLEDFFMQKGVRNIQSEVESYVKFREQPAESAISAAPSVAEAAPRTKPLPPETDHQKHIPGTSFGAVLKGLVESAVKDPQERAHIYEETLNMVKETMNQHVASATKVLFEEKERVLGERMRTEQVLSTVAEGKVIVDKNGHVLMMNPAAEEMSGKSFSETAGKHITEAMKAGEHVVAISKEIDLSKGKLPAGKVDILGDSQIKNALRRSLALVEDAQGRVVGTYATLPDIAKFKETQKMQDEFLSRVTHDLQAPLSSIYAALELLTENATAKLTPDEVGFLDISLKNTRRLSKMIREILDFSKLESGKMSVSPAPASAAAMIAEAVEALQPWARTKNLKLAARLPEPDLTVMADNARIVQVLTNLISNAIKASSRNGSVTVAASSAEHDGRSVVFAVRDTGCGIPKEYRKKIFEKFVQLGGAAASREGVGLGLSIVNELVKLHGGTVWVESEKDKGSTFYFTLPLSEVKAGLPE